MDNNIKSDYNSLLQDIHYQPKINYEALNKLSDSKNEYLTVLRDAITSTDKYQHSIAQSVSELEKKIEEQSKENKEAQNKANIKANLQIAIAAFAALMAFLSILKQLI